MKTLVLLRHAKSSWEYAVADRNRTLTERGMQRIEQMALNCSDIFIPADCFYSSPANRACHTASIALHTLKQPFDRLKIVEELYTFEPLQVLRFINALPDVMNYVVCVGHNPAFTEVAAQLSGSSFFYLPTAAWAKLTFSQSSWSAVSEGKLELGLPKEILN